MFMDQMLNFEVATLPKLYKECKIPSVFGKHWPLILIIIWKCKKLRITK